MEKISEYYKQKSNNEDLIDGLNRIKEDQIKVDFVVFNNINFLKNPDIVMKYITKAINVNLFFIIQETIRLAQKDLVVKKHEAAKECQEILEQIKKE